MSSADQWKELQVLRKRLRGHYRLAEGTPALEPIVDRTEPLLSEFVRSFLVWEATSTKAASAVKRIEQAVVDFNELRVCLADEMIRLLGDRYPRVEERALRLRAALNELYAREHAVTLEHLPSLSKRDCRDYLESLDGVPRYVSSRMLLVALGGHAAPVDGRILRRLAEAELVPVSASPEEASTLLERRVRAGEMMEVYQLLQAWSDEAGPQTSDGAESPRTGVRRTRSVAPKKAAGRSPPTTARAPDRKKRS